MTQCAHEQSASCHPGLGGSLVRDKQHSLRTIGFVKPVTLSPPQSGLPPKISPGPRSVFQASVFEIHDIMTMMIECSIPHLMTHHTGGSDK